MASSVLTITRTNNFLRLKATRQPYRTLHLQRIPLLKSLIRYTDPSKVYSSALHSAAVPFTPARRFRNFPPWKASRRHVEIIHGRIDRKHFCLARNIHGTIDRSFHNACFMTTVYDSLPNRAHPSRDAIAGHFSHTFYRSPCTFRINKSRDR